MIINFKNTESEVTFEDIKVGELFLSALSHEDYDFYLKTEEICTTDGDMYNAIDISTGILIGFDDWEKVFEVEYTLDIRKKQRRE